MDINSKFDRVKLIFQDNFTKLQNGKVIIFGVGGVGSFALDCLYRSGVTNITIVDFDKFDITNQNRQIGSESLGESKVFALAKLYPNITPIELKLSVENIDSFNFDEYDVVIDAIDDIKAKVALAKKAYKKLICSLGSAKRIDPLKIKSSSIWNCYGDKFAKKFKDELKKANFNKNFVVIFSDEEIKCRDKGSFVGVTGAFGLTICSKTIQKILE